MRNHPLNIVPSMNQQKYVQQVLYKKFHVMLKPHNLHAHT